MEVKVYLHKRPVEFWTKLDAYGVKYLIFESKDSYVKSLV